MTEQAVDLGSTWAVLRRRFWVLVLVAVAGGLAGGGALLAFPPSYSSTSVVLLPAAAQPGSGRTGGYEADTQVLIVKSTLVLSRAAEQVRPRPTIEQVTDRVAVEAPTSAVLRITGDGRTAAESEALAAAVATAYVGYLEETARALSETQLDTLRARLDTLNASLAKVNAEITKASSRLAAEGRTSPAGRADAAALSDLTAVRASTVLDIDAVESELAGEDVTGGQVASSATVIQPASPGEQATLVTEVLSFVLGGAGIAVLLAASYVFVTNQRDPKLRSRDEIADAVGIPVVTSLRARPPRSVPAWRELLRGYTPDSPDAWGLRQLLHTIVPDAGKEYPTGEGFVLVVLSLSGDTAGLAVGPQIASFAASNGIQTLLYAAQQHESATPLWAACSQTLGRGDELENLLVTIVPDSRARVDLTVRVVVLDRDTPEPDPWAVDGARALLAVGSATVTRRNLADAVVAADRVGLTVQGIVVANPDPLDRTTGRLSPVERPGTATTQPTVITARTVGGSTAADGEPLTGPRRTSTGRGPR